MTGHPEGDSATTRTIRLIKAQALRDALKLLHDEQQDSPREFIGGIAYSVSRLKQWANEYEEQ